MTVLDALIRTVKRQRAVRRGFIETPIEADPKPEKLDQAEAEICPFSEAQLRDVGAMTAEVVEIQEGTHFVGIRLPNGQRETAYCEYSAALKTGDELYITARERGRQRIHTILGLVPPDQRKKVTHE